MNWSGAKNWLIILFVALNIFLVFTLIKSDMQTSVIEKETVLQTIDVLKQNGITCSEQIIPTKMPKLGSIDVQNSVYDPYTFASTLLGEGCASLSDGQYALGTKRLKLIGDTIEYTDLKPQDNIKNFKAQTAQKYALKWLGEHGFKTDTLLPHTSELNGSYLVFAQQKIDKYALLDSCLEITVTPNGITKMSGSWFLPSNGQNIFSNDAAQVRSVITVLLDFARDTTRINLESNEITQIDLGYTTGDKTTYHKYATAVPIWRIRCADNNEYFFDAR